MRYLVGFAFVLALVALPLSVSAQVVDETAIPEPRSEDAAPSSEPAPEEPALQLKLDDAGVEVAPTQRRAPDGYMGEELELRVKRAKIGIGASALSLVVGGILAGVAVPNLSCESSGTGVGDCPIPGWSLPVFITGVTLAGGGVLGMIATGALLGVRKRKMRRLGEAHYGTPRRFQWDLARSRLVF